MEAMAIRADTAIPKVIMAIAGTAAMVVANAVMGEWSR
jgi:hypothetical protein